ncbi:MAG: hypothetical protein JWR03_2175 [Cohnella sp.]|nr:hypothetical protein [Cohnella sp.]
MRGRIAPCSDRVWRERRARITFGSFVCSFCDATRLFSRFYVNCFCIGIRLRFSGRIGKCNSKPVTIGFRISSNSRFTIGYHV